MFVIFKSFSGCDYPIYNDKGVVERVIKFKGGCYANDISADDFASPQLVKYIELMMS